MRFFYSLLLLLSLPQFALAHVGHLGELAGHGHWIAVGAGVVAVGLAAWLGKKNSEQDNSTAESDCEDELETEAEPA